MIFIFPGQGSQTVGMGKDIYDCFAVARDVFHQVDDILDRKLSDIIFRGPKETLMMTENAQPALMTVSIAMLRTVEYLIKKPFYSLNQTQYLAGHSVGECTALCASGSIDLTTTAKLLSVRSHAMHNAFPDSKGGMLALLCFGNDKDIENVIEHIQKFRNCEISNDNGGGQIVVSGMTEDLERLANNLHNTAVKKIIKLNVSGPFHSSHMNSACKVMQAFVQNINFSTPIVPIISNVSAQAITDPVTIKDLLVKQIVSRVRWREIVLYAISKGCKNFVEIGAGNVLSKLVNRIDNTVHSISINSVTTLESFVGQVESFSNLLCNSC